MTRSVSANSVAVRLIRFCVIAILIGIGMNCCTRIQVANIDSAQNCSTIKDAKL